MGYRAIFGRERDFDPELSIDLMRFRKRLFVDTFGWDLVVEGDCERDQFDTPSAIYCAVFCDHELVGMFRLIRTDGPYLSAAIFQNLAQLDPFPNRPDAWEVSRFGVMAHDVRQASAINHAMMFYFARTAGARTLVAVTDLTYERALHQLGIRTRRYGPPGVVGIDRQGKPIQGVAGEIPMALQGGLKFQRLIDLSNSVEIEDASHVFRHQRVSA
jgi:N-acyl-L-homoserine lactone synthetase